MTLYRVFISDPPAGAGSVFSPELPIERIAGTGFAKIERELQKI